MSVTFEERERVRRRRRRKKAMMRTLRTILLMPSRMPRVSEQALTLTVKACETVGIAFVLILITSMLNPGTTLAFLRTVSAIAFFSLFFFIKLEEYQEMLENYSFD